MNIAARKLYDLFYWQYYVSSDQWKKHCVAKIALTIWKTFLYEDNCNYNFFKFNQKFTFFPFLSFCRNKKQQSNFQQAGGLVTNKYFCFLFTESRALFQRHPNSIDLFLHVISVPIIVLCFMSHQLITTGWIRMNNKYLCLGVNTRKMCKNKS